MADVLARCAVRLILLPWRTWDGVMWTPLCCKDRAEISDWEGVILERLMLDMTRLAAREAKEASRSAKDFRTGEERGLETAASPRVSFEDLLSASMKEVNALQLEADDKMRRLATGDVEDISEVVMASSRAEIALKLMMELRNKFVDAYQALSRIAG